MNARDTSITLESLKAEVESLTKKLSAFERQPQFPITVDFPKLNDGEKYVGLVVSADGTKREHSILLPGEFTGNWKDAMAWAYSIGGELFDRVEGALLSATMKDEFKPDWYWTREKSASRSGDAWVQYFYDGGQDTYGTYGQNRARAVRRLPI